MMDWKDRTFLYIYSWTSSAFAFSHGGFVFDCVTNEGLLLM